jgi:hypothetical protein
MTTAAHDIPLLLLGGSETGVKDTGLSRLCVRH